MAEPEGELHYYVNRNAQSNGDHEVHREGCPWMPELPARAWLGYFADCHQAVAEARKRYLLTNGCAHCSPSCHTS